MKKLLLVLTLGGFAMIVACSSSSSGNGSTPCNQNPWECPSGQTCWLKDANTFACLNSGPGKLGAACTPVAGAGECSDGLLCFARAGTTQGACTPYCDNSKQGRSCPTGEQCLPAMFAGSGAGTVQLCYGTSPPADAGPEAGHDAAEEATTDDGPVERPSRNDPISGPYPPPPPPPHPPPPPPPSPPPHPPP